MAYEMLSPGVIGFLDILFKDGNQNLTVKEYQLSEASPLTNKTLATSGIREASNVLVLAVVHQGNYSINPSSDTMLLPGMNVVVIGEENSLKQFHQYAEGNGEKSLSPTS